MDKKKDGNGAGEEWARWAGRKARILINSYTGASDSTDGSPFGFLAPCSTRISHQFRNALSFAVRFGLHQLRDLADGWPSSLPAASYDSTARTPTRALRPRRDSATCKC